MANSYNSQPIIIDTDTASGWRSLQTLNTGNLPTTAQQLSGAVTRQWGIHVPKLVLMTNGTTVAGTVTISDPNDSTVLWTSPVAAGVTAGIIKSEDWSEAWASWRDFKVTGVTATVTKLLIWYRP
jgi:hypothetical protein